MAARGYGPPPSLSTQARATRHPASIACGGAVRSIWRRRMADSPALPLDLSDYFGARSGHVVALGLRYVAHGDDWCELALDYDRRLISDLATGILASGPIVSLIDTAAGAAVTVRHGHTAEATLDLRVDYLRPARSGNAVFARCECYRLTRRIGFVRGIAYDGDAGDPIAHVAGTFVLGGGQP